MLFITDTEEIVRKIKLILEGLSGGAKMEWNEQFKGRKWSDFPTVVLL